MADILVDSDIFIDHLRGFRAFDPGAHAVFYSSLTRCELFAGTRPSEDVLRTLLSPFSEVVVDRNVAEEAGRLRREHSIRLADAVIAATARIHDFLLWTRNRRHFQPVPGLKLLDDETSQTSR